MLNMGWIELGGGGVTVRIYYDETQEASDDQPLKNGPRGYCLDLTNTTGRRAVLTVNGLRDTPVQITVGTGDPVTSGPAEGRSRTAAQMASLGFTTRGDVGAITLGG